MPERLLIVDDHAGFRAIARKLMELAGFEVFEVADGASALACVEIDRPAVVLLDIQLPDVDGFEVARRMSRLPEPPRVVLVSSRSSADISRRLAASPVAGFLAKVDLSAEAVRALVG